MEAFIKDKLIGTWKLISWTYTDANDNRVNYFSDNPSGILMYDIHGYMNAQLMKSGRVNLDAKTLSEGNPIEAAAAYQGYAAYFGKYYEVAPGKLIHEVEGSLFPNWVGQTETRYARFEDEFLILSAPPVLINGHETIFNVRWRRVL